MGESNIDNNSVSQGNFIQALVIIVAATVFYNRKAIASVKTDSSEIVINS